MKIVTWNIRHGGGTRVNEIIRILSEKYSEAEIIILTEFRNNAQGERIRQHLNNAGYTHIYAPTAGEKTNTIFVSSRSEMRFCTFPELGAHSHRVIKASNKHFTVYACYFPQKDEKKFIFQFLLKQVCTAPDVPIIITGDINTGKHFIDEEKATFFCAEYMQKLEEAGMCDAFRHLSPESRDYSWYSTPLRNGFRIDHFFVSEILKDRLISCAYSHEEREKKKSDHSVMVLELEC